MSAYVRESHKTLQVFYHALLAKAFVVSQAKTRGHQDRDKREREDVEEGILILKASTSD